MMEKKIIVKGLTSQLGNKLLQLSNFMAFCMENDLTMQYIGFGSYSAYFDFTDQRAIISYPQETLHKPDSPAQMEKKAKQLELMLRYPFVKRFFYTDKQVITRPGLLPSSMVSHLLLGTVDECDLDNPDEPLMQLSRKAKHAVFAGWKYRATKSFDKHSEKIKELLTPKKEYRYNVQQLMQKCRDRGELIIGVHIRQGDYKTHLNGRFYYELAVYHLKMQETLDLHPGKKVVFLVCSDQAWKEQDFPQFNVQLANGQIIEDMYALAQCDKIIGAPSTYSGWASFYGNVPLYHIVHPMLPVKADQFVVFRQKQFVEFNDIYKQ